jgi:protein-S-isoprenylcysteine O-methyltransferase Ste14
MNKFVKWQNQEHSFRKQLLFFGLGALIFPLFIPLALASLLPQVDKMLGIGSFFIGNINIIMGIITLLTGGSLAIWTVIAQIQLASGTPFPMIPTKKLIIIGPFKYCRNPMTLGTILAYSGIAILIGSYTSLLFVFLLLMILITYIKLVEEKELALRFGRDYVDYKKDTPFMLPIHIFTVKKK